MTASMAWSAQFQINASSFSPLGECLGNAPAYPALHPRVYAVRLAIRLEISIRLATVACPPMPDRFLYIFLDEAGNFDFSTNGTKYFLLGAITKERPFHAYKEMTELKYNLAELGVDLEYFHASENAQKVRDGVFGIIEKNLTGIRIDALIAEKSRVPLEVRSEEQFYARLLGDLLKQILAAQDLTLFKEILVFTDTIPVNKKRSMVEKAAKTTLAKQLPANGRYRLLHHNSKSNLDLQIADYCTWAIYRKWNGGDMRSYRHIQPAIASEIQFFGPEAKIYS